MCVHSQGWPFGKELPVGVPFPGNNYCFCSQVSFVSHSSLCKVKTSWVKRPIDKLAITSLDKSLNLDLLIYNMATNNDTTFQVAAQATVDKIASDRPFAPCRAQGKSVVCYIYIQMALIFLLCFELLSFLLHRLEYETEVLMNYCFKSSPCPSNGPDYARCCC